MTNFTVKSFRSDGRHRTLLNSEFRRLTERPDKFYTSLKAETKNSASYTITLNLLEKTPRTEVV